MMTKKHKDLKTGQLWKSLYEKDTGGLNLLHFKAMILTLENLKCEGCPNETILRINHFHENLKANRGFSVLDLTYVVGNPSVDYYEAFFLKGCLVD